MITFCNFKCAFLTHALLLNQANATWIDGCNLCTCEPDDLNILCKPLLCPAQPPVICNQIGQVKVTETVRCCKKDSCGK